MSSDLSRVVSFSNLYKSGDKKYTQTVNIESTSEKNKTKLVSLADKSGLFFEVRSSGKNAYKVEIQYDRLEGLSDDQLKALGVNDREIAKQKGKVSLPVESINVIDSTQNGTDKGFQIVLKGGVEIRSNARGVEIKKAGEQNAILRTKPKLEDDTFSVSITETCLHRALDNADTKVSFSSIRKDGHMVALQEDITAFSPTFVSALGKIVVAESLNENTQSTSTLGNFSFLKANVAGFDGDSSTPVKTSNEITLIKQDDRCYIFHNGSFVEIDYVHAYNYPTKQGDPSLNAQIVVVPKSKSRASFRIPLAIELGPKAPKTKSPSYALLNDIADFLGVTKIQEPSNRENLVNLGRLKSEPASAFSNKVQAINTRIKSRALNLDELDTTENIVDVIEIDVPEPEKIDEINVPEPEKTDEIEITEPPKEPEKTDEIEITEPPKEPEKVDEGKTTEPPKEPEKTDEVEITETPKPEPEKVDEVETTPKTGEKATADDKNKKGAHKPEKVSRFWPKVLSAFGGLLILGGIVVAMALGLSVIGLAVGGALVGIGVTSNVIGKVVPTEYNREARQTLRKAEKFTDSELKRFLQLSRSMSRTSKRFFKLDKKIKKIKESQLEKVEALKEIQKKPESERTRKEKRLVKKYYKNQKKMTSLKNKQREAIAYSNPKIIDTLKKTYVARKIVELKKESKENPSRTFADEMAFEFVDEYKYDIVHCLSRNTGKRSAKKAIQKMSVAERCIIEEADHNFNEALKMANAKYNPATISSSRLIPFGPQEQDILGESISKYFTSGEFTKRQEKLGAGKKAKVRRMDHRDVVLAERIAEANSWVGSFCDNLTSLELQRNAIDGLLEDDKKMLEKADELLSSRGRDYLSKEKRTTLEKNLESVSSLSEEDKKKAKKELDDAEKKLSDDSKKAKKDQSLRVSDLSAGR